MTEKQKVGRPATGRTTKTARVPKDCNMEVAMQLYYDILPSLVHWHEEIQGKEDMPRYDRIIKLFKELNISQEMLEAGK